MDLGGEPLAEGRELALWLGVRWFSLACVILVGGGGDSHLYHPKHKTGGSTHIYVYMYLRQVRLERRHLGLGRLVQLRGRHGACIWGFGFGGVSWMGIVDRGAKRPAAQPLHKHKD